MDNEYMTKMATSFLEELTEIEKQAQGGAILSFLGKGLGRLGGAITKKVPAAVAEKGLGMAHRLGGKAAVQAGGIMPHMKQLWGAGSQAAQAAGKSGVMGGLGALGRSGYGQMAGALAVPMAAGYGIHKMTS